MPLNDYQIKYNGLTLGDGTNFPLYSLEGLGAPDTRFNDDPRFDADGVTSGRDLMDKRVINIEIDFAETLDSGMESRLSELRNAFVRRIAVTDELPFYFKLPGGVTKRTHCRPRKRKVPVDLAFARKNPMIPVELVGSDPRIYLENNNVTEWASDGATQLLDNTGNVEMYPYIDILGPTGSTVVVTNVTRGRSVTLTNVNLSSGQTLGVYMDRLDAFLSDGTDMMAKVATTSKWWALWPGVTTVQVTTGAGGTRRIYWSPAWDGV